MKIIEAINTVDKNVPNYYTTKEKVEWLKRLDAKLIVEIYSKFEGNEHKIEDLDSYTEDNVREQELLAPIPYDIIYILWLEAMIHKNNNEIAKYNNAISLMAAEYKSFEDETARHHTYKQPPRYRW